MIINNVLFISDNVKYINENYPSNDLYKDKRFYVLGIDTIEKLRGSRYGTVYIDLSSEFRECDINDIMRILPPICNLIVLMSSRTCIRATEVIHIISTFSKFYPAVYFNTREILDNDNNIIGFSLNINDVESAPRVLARPFAIDQCEQSLSGTVYVIGDDGFPLSMNITDALYYKKIKFVNEIYLDFETCMNACRKLHNKVSVGDYVMTSDGYLRVVMGMNKNLEIYADCIDRSGGIWVSDYEKVTYEPHACFGVVDDNNSRNLVEIEGVVKCSKQIDRNNSTSTVFYKIKNKNCLYSDEKCHKLNIPDGASISYSNTEDDSLGGV